MGLLNKVFKKKDTSIKSYADFWAWFYQNEKTFHQVVKSQNRIESAFFDKLSPKLDQLHDGLFFLAGMFDENTAELVITVDGAIENIYVAEEIVSSAPAIQGWKFTALKPAIPVDDFSIKMNDLTFGSKNIFFYANDSTDYPDDIDLTFVYDDPANSNKDAIDNGMYIYLDNYLGELAFVTIIDNLNMVTKGNATKELIPVSKLKDYLHWRQKEFSEKYQGKMYNTETGNYSSMEGELENGMPVIAILNMDMLHWDAKASHPWMVIIEVEFPSENNGMPDQGTYDLMNEMEDSLLKYLIDSEGYLNIGRETCEGTRRIYFACKDFRLPAKILDQTCYNYQSKLKMSYHIFKDKYWRSVDKFQSL